MFSELTANRLKLTSHDGGVNYRDLLLRSLLVSNVLRGTGSLLVVGPDAVSMNTHEVRVRSATGAAYVTHLSAVGGVMDLLNTGDVLPAAAGKDLGAIANRFDYGWLNYLGVTHDFFADRVYGYSEMRIPVIADANATINNMRYNGVTDTFEIYDGAAWQAH